MPGAQQLIDPAAYLVAHRGDQEAATENTLAAFQAAVAAGARFLECDIQFTREYIPVVLHDNWLMRLCGDMEAKVMALTLAELRGICRRFPLLTLDEMLAWLGQTPDVTLFLEIKPTIRRRVSENAVARIIAEHLPAPLAKRIVLISKSGSVIDACGRHLPAMARGWVAEGHHPPKAPFDYVMLAASLAGEFDSWRTRGVKIGVYTVNEAAAARRLRDKGADFVETNYFTRLRRALGHA